MLEAARGRLGRWPSFDRHPGRACVARRPALARSDTGVAVRDWPASAGRGTARYGRGVPVIVGGQTCRPDETKDAAQVRAVAGYLAARDQAGELAPLFFGDPGLTPKQREQVEREEAWTLGVTAARQRPIAVAVDIDPHSFTPAEPAPCSSRSQSAPIPPPGGQDTGRSSIVIPTQVGIHFGYGYRLSPV